MKKKDENDVLGFKVTATPTGSTPQIKSFSIDTPSNEITGSTKTIVSEDPLKDAERIDKTNNWLDIAREMLRGFGEDIDLEIEEEEEVEVQYKGGIKIKAGLTVELTGGVLEISPARVPKKIKRKKKMKIKGRKKIT